MRAKEALAEAASRETISYLEGCGFRILDQNWRSGSEILPIITVERRTLVVIDLRVRAGTPGTARRSRPSAQTGSRRCAGSRAAG